VLKIPQYSQIIHTSVNIIDTTDQSLDTTSKEEHRIWSMQFTEKNIYWNKV